MGFQILLVGFEKKIGWELGFCLKYNWELGFEPPFTTLCNFKRIRRKQHILTT